MNSPTICIVGCASWDTLLPVDRYPAEGEYCIATDEFEMPGGTSTNTAHALARLGDAPRFVGVVGDDWRGERLRAGLEAAGVQCDLLGTRQGQDSDRSIIPISPTGGRTIFWIKGAMLRRGDALDLPRIFAHPLVYIDVVDLDLWADILTAREHASASAPMVIGQAVYVAGVLPPDDALALVRRHHAFVGGEWEWKLITGADTRAAMLARIVTTLPGSSLRAAVVTQGAEGCTVVTPEGTQMYPAYPVTVVDTTGAGDAFGAGFAYGMVRGWPVARCAQFANAVGGLATRALGAQASLPTLDEAWEIAFGADNH